jgi:hypothetical protein
MACGSQEEGARQSTTAHLERSSPSWRSSGVAFRSRDCEMGSAYTRRNADRLPSDPGTAKFTIAYSSSCTDGGT